MVPIMENVVSAISSGRNTRDSPINLRTGSVQLQNFVNSFLFFQVGIPKSLVDSDRKDSAEVGSSFFSYVELSRDFRLVPWKVRISRKTHLLSDDDAIDEWLISADATNSFGRIRENNPFR